MAFQADPKRNRDVGFFVKRGRDVVGYPVEDLEHGIDGAKGRAVVCEPDIDDSIIEGETWCLSSEDQAERQPCRNGMLDDRRADKVMLKTGAYVIAYPPITPVARLPAPREWRQCLHPDFRKHKGG